MMPARGFAASTRHHTGVAIIDLHGEIDRAAADTLSSTYREATGRNEAAILLNFEDVDYINSTGIAVIVGLLAQARTQGRSVSACGLSDHYKEIFEITRLSDFMTIVDVEDKAVTNVSAEGADTKQGGG
jgi:anti-anti-sigma factor